MKFFTCLLLSMLAFYPAYTQCRIDTTISTYGFHPDTGSFLKPGCNGSWYESSVQIYAPDSVFVGGNVYAVNFVRPDSVKNLPNGISYYTNPPSGVLAGGERGCINFQGPLIAPVDTYYFVIYYTANFDLFGGTSLSFIAPYRMQVYNGNVTYGNLFDTICSFQTYSFNNTDLNVTGMYYDTLENVAGCDSILTLELTVNSFDTSVVVNAGVLKAPAGFPSYLWRDCSSLNILASGPDSVFTPQAGISVTVSYGNQYCTYTSPCIDYLASLDYLGDDDGIYIYPNPVKESLTVKFENDLPRRFVIRNMEGRELITIYYPEKETVIDVSSYSGGVYFIDINFEEENYMKKVFKF